MINRRNFIKNAALGVLAMNFFPEKIFAANETADLLIFGNFYTVDEKNPHAKAVAIKNGKFLYVGDEIGVKNFIGKNTKQQKYNRGVITPGFVDGHAHGNLGGSKMLLMCSLNGCKTVEKIREKLKDFIEKNPEMEKI